MAKVTCSLSSSLMTILLLFVSSLWNIQTSVSQEERLSVSVAGYDQNQTLLDEAPQSVQQTFLSRQQRMFLRVSQQLTRLLQLIFLIFFSKTKEKSILKCSMCYKLTGITKYLVSERREVTIRYRPRMRLSRNTLVRQPPGILLRT